MNVRDSDEDQYREYECFCGICDWCLREGKNVLPDWKEELI